MNTIKSILTDCKSWNKILLNRWHLHAPIAFVIGIGLFIAFNKCVTDTNAISQALLKIFVPSFLGFSGLFLFELAQQGGRFIGAKERFESNKDLFVGEFFLVLGVILTYIIL